MDLFYRQELRHLTDVHTGKKVVLTVPWYSVQEQVVTSPKFRRRDGPLVKQVVGCEELRRATMLEF